MPVEFEGKGEPFDNPDEVDDVAQTDTPDLSRLFSGDAFGTPAKKRYLGVVLDESLIFLPRDDSLPSKSKPAELRRLVEKLDPERGERFTQLGKRVERLAIYLEDEAGDTPTIRKTTDPLKKYGEELRLEDLPDESVQPRELTSEEQIQAQAEFDDYCGITRLHRVLHPDKTDDPEALAKTRKKALTQFFKVAERAAGGSEVDQKAVAKTYKRYLQAFADEPERELVNTIVGEGIKGLTGIVYSYDLSIARNELKVDRKAGNNDVIGESEKVFVDELRRATSSIPGKSGRATPADFAREGKINCVNATTIAGQELAQQEISYAVVRAPGHVLSLVAYADGEVSLEDFAWDKYLPLSDAQIAGEAPDGSPLTVATLAEWIKNPTEDGLVLHLDHETYGRQFPDLADDKRDYLYLASPEQGHRAGVLEWISEKLLKKGLAEEALLAGQQMLALTPKDPYSYCNLAFSLVELDRNTEALAVIEQGLSLEIMSSVLLGQKALVLFSMDREEEALPWAEKATEISPKNADCWGIRARIEKSLGNWEQAAHSYQQIMDLTPEDEVNGNTYSNYGISLWHLGRHEESYPHLIKAIEKNPDNPTFLRHVAKAQIILGKFAEAKRSYERLFELQEEKNPWSYASYAGVLHQLGQIEESLAFNTKAIELQPDNAELWRLRGFAFFRMENFEQAARDIEQAIVLDPEDLFNRGSLGLVRYAQGDYASAEREFECAVGTDDPDLYYNLALTKEQLKKPHEVQSLLEKAYELAQKEKDEDLLAKLQQKLGISGE